MGDYGAFRIQQLETALAAAQAERDEARCVASFRGDTLSRMAEDLRGERAARQTAEEASLDKDAALRAARMFISENGGGSLLGGDAVLQTIDAALASPAAPAEVDLAHEKSGCICAPLPEPPSDDCPQHGEHPPAPEASAVVADTNVAAVCRKLQERSARGVQKYGVTTDQTGLSVAQWLAHLQEELLDGAVYIEAALTPTPAPAPAAGEDERQRVIQPLLDLIRPCVRDNIGALDLHLENVRIDGEDTGDWMLHLARVAPRRGENECRFDDDRCVESGGCLFSPPCYAQTLTSPPGASDGQ